MNGTSLLSFFVALFAFFGCMYTIRWIMQACFGSKKLYVAIEILTQREAESAEWLIRDALSQYLFLPSARLCLLTSRALKDHPEILRLRKRYGLAHRVIEETESNS